MMNISKEKLDSNIQVNFNKSKEVDYWAKKLNISSIELQKKFEQFDFSISKLIAYYQQ